MCVVVVTIVYCVFYCMKRTSFTSIKLVMMMKMMRKTTILSHDTINIVMSLFSFYLALINIHQSIILKTVFVAENNADQAFLKHLLYYIFISFFLFSLSLMKKITLMTRRFNSHIAFSAYNFKPMQNETVEECKL